MNFYNTYYYNYLEFFPVYCPNFRSPDFVPKSDCLRILEQHFSEAAKQNHHTEKVDSLHYWY